MKKWGFLYVILLSVVVLSIFFTKRKSISFFVQHSRQDSLSLEITLDGKVMFEGEVSPSKKMPPIVSYKELYLSKGEHTVKFIDKTRMIEEEENFMVPETKFILITTEGDIDSGRHITISADVIPIK